MGESEEEKDEERPENYGLPSDMGPIHVVKRPHPQDVVPEEEAQVSESEAPAVVSEEDEEEEASATLEVAESPPLPVLQEEVFSAEPFLVEEVVTAEDTPPATTQEGEEAMAEECKLPTVNPTPQEDDAPPEERAQPDSSPLKAASHAFLFIVAVVVLIVFGIAVYFGDSKTKPEPSDEPAVEQGWGQSAQSAKTSEQEEGDNLVRDAIAELEGRQTELQNSSPEEVYASRSSVQPLDVPSEVATLQAQQAELRSGNLEEVYYRRSQAIEPVETPQAVAELQARQAELKSF